MWCCVDYAEPVPFGRKIGAYGMLGAGGHEQGPIDAQASSCTTDLWLARLSDSDFALLMLTLWA